MQLGTHVHFLGFRSDVPALLRCADIFVLASHHEPFELVLLEARQAGCPMIACQVGGIPEVLEGGEAGLLIDPKDSQQIVAAVRRLLDEPDFANELRTRGLQGLDYWTPKRMSAELQKIYAECIDRKAK